MRKKIPDSLEVIREACDYLSLRLDISNDMCRWLDKLDSHDSKRVLENPNVSFTHESEIVGKLHVLRIKDCMGNSIGSVQLARPGAQGFFSELHLQGNFWFLFGIEYVQEFISLFGRSVHDEQGIARLDYAIDVPYDSSLVQEIFDRMEGTKNKKQPRGSESDTWQSIGSRRLKTLYYDKKLDILKELDNGGTGNRKYDLVDINGDRPFRKYFDSHKDITRIEQRRMGEAMREQCHSVAWYLNGGLRTLTLEDLAKKGLHFDTSERMKLKYEKRDEDWKNYSESVLADRKEHSKKMFYAYAKSLSRFGLLESELQNMTDFLTVGELAETTDKAIRKEMGRIFY